MATISKAQRERLARADRERASAARRAERARADAARQLQESDAEIDRLIAETGWAVCVGEAPGDVRPAPYFAYTIGRSAKNQPELCAWGHVREELPPLLNMIGGFLELENKVAQAGEVLVLPGVGAWEILRVPPEVFDHLEFARKRYTFLRAVRLRRIA